MTSLPTFAAGLLFTCLTSLLPLRASSGASPSFIALVAAKDAPEPVVLSAAERAYYTAAFEQQIVATYTQARLLPAGLPLETFRKAVIGFYSLQQRGAIAASCHTVTIIDFGRSSTQERFWVVDMAQNRLVHRSLVAHGKNTGADYARTFSNREGSEMSSLGFYVTGETYQGKHGLSLKLRGVDAGYNTNALSRAVVVHGAEYVSQDFVRQHGRLGRSQGCPALPVTQAPAIIRTIKGGTVLFANAPGSVLYHSELLKLDQALLAFAQLKHLAVSAG
ncbi:hypothetical protein ABIB60_000231 [Hymenobacter sp. UYP22]